MARHDSTAGPPKEQRRPGRGGVERARGTESRNTEASAPVAQAQADHEAEAVARRLLSRAVRHGTLSTIEFEASVVECAFWELVDGKRLDPGDMARVRLALSRIYGGVRDLRPAGTTDAWGLGRP